MTTPGRIVAVAPAGLDYLFGPVIAGLQAAGHVVDRHMNVAGFLAAPEALTEACILLAIGELSVGPAMLAAAPKLRAVISPYTGISGFDENAATGCGVLIANGHAAENTDSMAEATVMLILALQYDLHGSERALRENRPRDPVSKARMLKGKQVGLIGFGQMGQAVAQRLGGWGVRLQTFSPRTPPDIQPDVQRVALETLLATSDVVAVVTSLTPATQNLLDAGRLALLKPDAVLVNTARGGIIDEAALMGVAAAKPGLRIALDVFAREPLPLDSPVRGLAGAILTPHRVGHTQESLVALQHLAVENVLNCLAGVPPRYVCNPAVLARWSARWAG